MRAQDTASILQERRLYLLLTRSLCRSDPIWTLREALAAGVDLVQVREKPFEEDGLSWCREIVGICREHQVPVFVNDAIELVSSSGAFGVHLGQGDLVAYPGGALRERDFALGLSTHDDEELEIALAHAPDCLGAGPCFATATKGYDQANSPAWLRESFAAAHGLPVYAIGGITQDNLPQLLQLGAQRIAVSSVVLGAEQPAAVTEQLRALLDSPSNA
jgi:thiamine-phosphate pyrophosphorylase